MTTDALSLRQRVLGALTMGALFFMVYGSVNTFTAGREPVPSLFFGWETQIPFVDWMIIPYMALDALFVGAFLLCRERRAINALSARITLAILLSAAGFLLFPMQFAFAKPATTGLPSVLFHWLALDLPYNQCPSLHVSLSMIIGSVYVHASRGLLKWLLVACFVLTAVSTLFVYQHHVIDLIGGAGVGLLVIGLLPVKPVSRHSRLAARYAGVACIAVLLAVWLQSFAWGLLYPALSLLLVALAYVSRNAKMLCKSAGNHPWLIRFLLAPYLLGVWLNWQCYRLRCQPWNEIAPRLVLGRRLTETEARRLRNEGVTAVLDLAPELTEPRTLTGLQYRHIPMLDLVPPSVEQLQASVAFIKVQVRRGTVYVHCALGYSRSALVVAAYLTGNGITATQAESWVQAARPHVMLSPVSHAAHENC